MGAQLYPRWGIALGVSWRVLYAGSWQPCGQRPSPLASVWDSGAGSSRPGAPLTVSLSRQCALRPRTRPTAARKPLLTPFPGTPPCQWSILKSGCHVYIGVPAHLDEWEAGPPWAHTAHGCAAVAAVSSGQPSLVTPTSARTCVTGALALKLVTLALEPVGVCGVHPWPWGRTDRSHLLCPSGPGGGATEARLM